MIRCYSSSITAQPLRKLRRKSDCLKVKPMVDVKKIRAIGGKGGDGCISFLRLWVNDKAGPDGGDGGHGGHVLIEASTNVNSLEHVNVLLKGANGEKGHNKDCHGKNAKHTIIQVPVGTVVKSENTILSDLDKPGCMFVLARGGAGGKGNHFFTSDSLQAPLIAECGAPGEDNSYELEIKSVANFGLIGLPNAGKSTLLQAISRAKPVVAPYPFTTLKPYLGIVEYSDYEKISVADLPGLIEDSHKGRGLGLQFLRHAERCTCLVIVLDATNEPLDALKLLQKELVTFSRNLAEKEQLVVINKIDLLESEVLYLHG